MDSRKVAARFMAFACYLNSDVREPHSPEEAGELARDTWKEFLPYVDEKLGKALTEKPAGACSARTARRGKAVSALASVG